MDSGFGQNLEGFLIKGNLSLAPSANPTLQGDGSLEGSGTLYFDEIKEYNFENGVNIQNVTFKNGNLYVPYTNSSDSATSASVIIDGGLSIKHTQNSTSVTSGGALTVVGGASIGKRLTVGGDIDASGNYLKNVAYPVLGSDGVNVDYVRDYVENYSSNISGNFTTGQIIIGDSDGSSIRGYDFFTTDTQKIYMGLPINILTTSSTLGLGSGGSLNVIGGASLGGDVYIGGVLDLSGNIIRNVASPVNDSDSATKKYVDDRKLQGNFTTGQLIVADSNGDAIRGYDNLTYDGYTITLGSTSNITGSVGGSFVCYGGISISKDVFVGGYLNVNNNNITNVATPILGGDAVNKDYVDNLITNRFSSFTAGQLIVADSAGSLRGYDNLRFTVGTDGTSGTLVLNNNTTVVLNNTKNASGLNSSGALVINGGISVLKDVFIGGELDVNMNNIKSVADPIENYDAVNKAYIDTLISNINAGQGISTNVFNLENNVLVPGDIPLFYQPSTIKAFVANIYAHYNNEKFAFYTIYGFHTDNNWVVNSTFIGNDIGVSFHIRDNGGQGVLQYTNTNTTGFASIRFSTLFRIEDLDNTTQDNIDISSNVSTFTDIPELTFLNNTVDSVKLCIYVSSETDKRYGLVILNALLSNGTWYYSTRNIGDVDNIKFGLRSTASSGIVEYTNTNTSSDYVIRVYQTNFLLTQPQLTLNANTNIVTNVGSSALTFQGITSFTLSVVLTVPSLNKSALYEITGVLLKNIWQINSKFIGDHTGVKFYINTISGGSGVLQYTNPNGVDAYIRFIKNVPNVFEPLGVPIGGTGNSTLLPYAVLRGNGTSPIIGTDDFIYKDYKLTLGSQSSIQLNSTTNAIGLTNGGTLTSNGGASFLKDVYIGGKLDVNMNNITSVADPIEDYDAVNKLYVDDLIANVDLNNNQNQFEQSLVLNNGVVVSPLDIPGFNFSDNVKAFVSHIYVQTSTGRSALYTIRGFYSGSNWVISSTLIGDTSTGVDFHIRDDAGSAYVQYTNQNVVGSSSLRYVTNSIVYNDASSEQINHNLLPNINTFTDIPSLTFPTANIDSIKMIIYVSSVTDDKYGMILGNCVLKGSDWIINTYNIGNVRGITFGIRISGSNIIVQYTNSNTSSDYTLRVLSTSIPTSQTPITLQANTNVPTEIDETLLGIPVTQYYFEYSIIVNVPSLNKSALYEIQGVVCNSTWNINYRYIGDYTGIKFYINTVGGIGYLAYTNSNSVDANIKFIKNSPLTSLKPLQVSKGGTGSTFFNPYTILRGNGLDPIIGTSDLVYENNKLILGDSSVIVLKNTSSAINLSTGSTFIAYGGVSINKELFVGQQLVVNDVDITPNPDDVYVEKVFGAGNNIVVPTSINGFQFSNTKSFCAMVCVNITTASDEYDALFELRGLKKKTSWIIDSSYIGDNLGIDFTIGNNGQIKYTSADTTDWISTTIKFRATTLT